MPPLADILHRTFVVGLLGVTVAGVGIGWAVHKDTLKRGQGTNPHSVFHFVELMNKREAEVAASQVATVEQIVQREQELAVAAQNIFKGQK